MLAKIIEIEQRCGISYFRMIERNKQEDGISYWREIQEIEAIMRLLGWGTP